MRNTAAAAAFDPDEGPDAAAVRAAEETLSAAANLVSVDPAKLSSDVLLTYVGLLGNVARVVEGQQVGNVGDIARRSDVDAGFSGLAASHGAKGPTGLFEKITGVKNSAAHRFTRVAKQTTPRLSDTGLPLDPVFVQTAEALAEGTIGLDVAEAITSVLGPVLSRVAPEQMDWAEAKLIGNATGAYGEAPHTADGVRVQARAFVTVLDPDGVKPSADELHAARTLVFKHLDDGSMKITGVLSPEQAAQVTPVFDAVMSKRTSPTFLHTEELASKHEPAEERSRSQERADVFTAMIAGIGKQKNTPQLHGRGPTVLVTTTTENVDNDTGAAWSPGTPAPLPMSFVKQMQCDGDTHDVTIDEHGDVLNLGGATRFFTAKQRLALIARDGTTCVVDDCNVPVWMCEAHHILRWEDGGPTDLPNGVLVCWYHHRLLDHDDWTITRDDNEHPQLVPPGWYVNRRYLGRRKAPRDGVGNGTRASSSGTTSTRDRGSALGNATSTPENGRSRFADGRVNKDHDPPDDGRDIGPRS
ncbi:HNH endonuclease signature motif containing protein [Microbacterium sp. MPKO10]|uniref:HNH endonuclease signature motif containing protein n=1 Tax=Microbacterium sp. MPKO10 TaxID=2989818 RepID=UPI0022354A6A|nr:HNH endonuclease signature motif containing protein [Microbacterium sp. MPKO10]MCW4459874.1 HNH endonuclease [Microbacterium sp. MPKO10]